MNPHNKSTLSQIQQLTYLENLVNVDPQAIYNTFKMHAEAEFTIFL